MKRQGYVCDDDEERARAMRDVEVALSGALVARILVYDANKMLNVDLFVEDRGAGMAPATLANATVPFFTTKRGQGGSGLGLGSVARVVHAAGGHFRITSVAGVGTTMHLWVPPILEPSRST
jgi:signal transduction histidine kinase